LGFSLKTSFGFFNKPPYWDGMTLILVNSSAIRAVGYDGSNLAVEFHNGRIYEHPDVPDSVYVGLMQAPSMGAYYNQNIRGRYK
jgi:KTSC domain-containing protein